MIPLTLARPPIEALTPTAWARVEREVFRRLEAARLQPARSVGVETGSARSFRYVASLPWALSTALAVAAACAIAGVHGGARAVPASPAVVETVSALLERPAPSRPDPPHTTDAVATFTTLPEPSPDGLRVATDDAPRELSVGESRFKLATRSELSVRGDDTQGWKVELLRGQLETHVAPRNGRPPFVVQAGSVTVRVVGTRFSVKRSEHVTEVGVSEGVVEVADAGQVSWLASGDRWSNGVVTRAQREPPIARAAPRQRLKRASVSAPQRTPSERFERAARLEYHDAPAALRAYRQLAKGQGAWAANALYAGALLELEQGDADGCRALLAQYLRRFPNGSNAGDVRALGTRLGSSPKKP